MNREVFRSGDRLTGQTPRIQRILIFGRGGSGKSRLAERLSVILALPLTELDELFWSEDLSPTPVSRWVELQDRLSAAERWILDGDLGPFDEPSPRLRAADTVILLDLPACRCAWRALRRAREGRDFWWWLMTWRFRSRPQLLRRVATHAPDARLHILKSPREVDDFLKEVASNH